MISEVSNWKYSDNISQFIGTGTAARDSRGSNTSEVDSASLPYGKRTFVVSFPSPSLRPRLRPGRSVVFAAETNNNLLISFSVPVFSVA